MEIICCCCCCLCTAVGRVGSCNGAERRIFFIVLFVLTLALGGVLIWYIPVLQDLKQQNAAKIPNLQTCSSICGQYYVDGTIENTCCWDLINKCYSKEQCQENNANYFDWSIILSYVVLGAGGSYAAGFSIYYIFRLAKSCLDGHNQRREAINEALVEQDRNGINSDSSLSRLKESFVLRDSQNICSICLQVFSEQKAVELKCEHLFHSKCIKDWIKSHNTCPLCRDKV